MADTKTKTPLTPEQKARRKAATLIGLSQWRQDWRSANPDATPQQLKQAWAAVRKEETKKARQTLRTLEKNGFKLVPAES